MFKKIVMVIVIIALLGGLYRMWELRQQILAENQALELFDNDQPQDALDKYQEIMAKLSNFTWDNATRNRLRNRIALCYKALGERPELGLQDSLEFYLKAREFDASVISDPAILKLLEKPAGK